MVCSNCTADQRFVFATRIVQLSFTYIQNFKLLALCCDCTIRFESDWSEFQIVGFLMHRLKSVYLSRPAAQVGRQLAKIGDDINQRYQPEFDQMINQLNINQATAYDAFAGVAKK